jgi:sugar/nucleoside kinase (ribokinase family)
MKIIGIGACCVDILALVSKFPNKDQKIRTLNSEILVGGNCSNVLRTLKQFNQNFEINLLSTIGNDYYSDLILKTLKSEKISTNFISKQEMKTSFTYIIIEKETNTRTCIHTPSPFELEINFEIPKEINFIFLDGRHLNASIEFISKFEDIPILLDFEKFRNEELERKFILPRIDYLISPKNQILNLGMSEELLISMKFILNEFKNLKFVICTLGKEGSLMMHRVEKLKLTLKELKTFEELRNVQHRSFTVSGPFSFEGFEILYCSVFPVSENVMVDTTGCGDAFTASVIYSILMKFDKINTLTFATKIASEKCKFLGGCGNYEINSILESLNI